MGDAILYSSCFDANGGLFEALLGKNDAVISDELNHASIINGVRLCKARRYRYAHHDMADLRAQLQADDAAGARHRSDERRVGKECVSMGNYRCSPCTYKKKSRQD